MSEPTDPRPLARVVTIVVAVWIVAELLLLAAKNMVLHESEPLATTPPSVAVAGLAALLQLGSYLVSIIVVGRWIWRTSANAHGLATGMSITPGWAVGWFFVPVGNLFKPFEAIKETWQVSHEPNEWPLVPVPALLRWWWGCWIASNIGANLSWQLSRGGLKPGLITWIDMSATVLGVVSGALLIRLVHALSAAQARAIAARAFM